MQKHELKAWGYRKKNSTTGTRTRVARVKAEYPNQLDYSGFWQQGPSESIGPYSRRNQRAWKAWGTEICKTFRRGRREGERMEGEHELKQPCQNFKTEPVPSRQGFSSQAPLSEVRGLTSCQA